LEQPHWLEYRTLDGTTIITSMVGRITHTADLRNEALQQTGPVMRTAAMS